MQPEILGDLRRGDLADAETRLRALTEALGAKADIPDPDREQQALHQVLTLPRYAAIHAPPSPLERVRAWLAQRFRDLWALLAAAPVNRTLPWLLLAGTALVIVALWLTRGALQRGAEDVRPADAQRRVRPAGERFHEADRRAAVGDFVGALRALAVGVAAALSGEQAWEESPLTVRELFQRAPRPELLAPLLLPFEAAIYGHRVPNAETYARAREAAVPFRPPLP